MSRSILFRPGVRGGNYKSEQVKFSYLLIFLFCSLLLCLYMLSFCETFPFPQLPCALHVEAEGKEMFSEMLSILSMKQQQKDNEPPDTQVTENYFFDLLKAMNPGRKRVIHDCFEWGECFKSKEELKVHFMIMHYD